MARTLLTPHSRSRTLANGSVTFAAADAVNGNSFDNTTQDYDLWARNDDASDQTITVPKRLTADGESFTNDPITLTAGETYVFDWFENQYYGWNDVDNSLNSKNAVIINVSSANIKLAVVPRGSRTTLVE